MATANAPGSLARPGLLVKLRPSRPWRIGPASGERDRVDPIYHSDTLYSAVTHAMRLLGRLEHWLEVTARATETGPLIKFTSMFPFFGDTLYVVPPRHIWPPAATARVPYSAARFVPIPVVESILAGKPLQDDRWSVDGVSECLVPSGKGGPFRVSVRASAAVDRLTGSAEPHRAACVEFVPKAGLWFAVWFADQITREQWHDPLCAAIRLLADSGFGGERSRGWGRAHNPEFRDGSLPQLIYRGAATGERLQWTLSLVSPAEKDQVEWDRGSYSVTVRGGRIDSPAGSGAAKKLLTMIEEGSVLASTILEGSAPDVAPEGFSHPVYHAGWAFSIAVPAEVRSEQQPEVLQPEVAPEREPEPEPENEPEPIEEPESEPAPVAEPDEEIPMAEPASEPDDDGPAGPNPDEAPAYQEPSE